jgi:hypothetical protein
VREEPEGDPRTQQDGRDRRGDGRSVTVEVDHGADSVAGRRGRAGQQAGRDEGQADGGHRGRERAQESAREWWTVQGWPPVTG